MMCGWVLKQLEVLKLDVRAQFQAPATHRVKNPGVKCV
jgi:hypothetical protein